MQFINYKVITLQLNIKKQLKMAKLVKQKSMNSYMKSQFRPLSLCSMIDFNYKVMHHFLQRTLCME